MYCTVQDIKDRFPENVLIYLTDDTGTGIVDETKVAEAIEEATGEIDAYCQVRYTLPFNPVPKVIKKFCISLVVYTLFARRGLNPDNNQDAIVIQERKDAIRFLENVAKGVATIGPAPDQTGVPEQTVEIHCPVRVFSRNKLRGF